VGDAAPGAPDPPDLIPTFVFDVAHLPEEQQFSAWAAHVANSRTSRPQSAGPFQARAQFWQMEPLLISEQHMDAFAFERDEAMVRAAPSDRYQLVVVLKGRLCFPRATGDLFCDARGAVFTDLTRPEHVRADPAHTITIHCARWFLDEAISPRDAQGPLPRTPAVEVLVDFVAALVRQLPSMRTRSALPMARVVRDLIAAALADHPPLPGPGVDARSPVRQRVRAWLDEQPPGAVSLPRMCQTLGMSRSTLNRAFKPEGGVLAYDRRRRLRALHARLSDPGEMRSVAELGYAFGFADKARLSRVFRDAFGYPPSELRRQAAAVSLPIVDTGDLAQTYKAALSRLA
jgi:AraC-like DNA-binding protein